MVYIIEKSLRMRNLGIQPGEVFNLSLEKEFTMLILNHLKT